MSISAPSTSSASQTQKHMVALMSLLTNLDAPKVMGSVCSYSLLGFKAEPDVSTICTHFGSEFLHQSFRVCPPNLCLL